MFDDFKLIMLIALATLPLLLLLREGRRQPLNRGRGRLARRRGQCDVLAVDVGGRQYDQRSTRMPFSVDRPSAGKTMKVGSGRLLRWSMRAAMSVCSGS